MRAELDLSDFEGVAKLFPLPNVVLFPYAIMPLHIFEPRYRQMTRDALDSDQRVTIVLTESETASTSQIESVACLGKILSHERMPDGKFNFLLMGQKRVRVVRELSVTTLYRQAEVEILDDIEPILDESVRREELIRLYREAARHNQGLDSEMENLLENEPPLGLLTDIMAQTMGFPPKLKQSFLADIQVDRRADNLITILRQVVTHFNKPNTGRLFPPPFSVN